MAVTDLAGTWQYLGTITPNFDSWSRFPTATQADSALVRLTYYGELNKVVSFGYIRPVYYTPEAVYGSWRKIFPKEGKEVILLSIPRELLLASRSVRRYFEVRKRAKGYPAYYQVRDTSWSVAIENLEIVNLTANEQILLEETERIELSAEIIRTLLTGSSGSNP